MEKKIKIGSKDCLLFEQDVPQAVLIQMMDQDEREGMAEENSDSWKAEAEEMLRDGMSVKDIVEEFAGRVPKNEVKRFLMK